MVIPGSEDAANEVGAAGGGSVEPWIRNVREPRAYFAILDDEAHCFEFEGSGVDCWIEVEIDGESTRHAERTAEQARIMLEAGQDVPGRAADERSDGTAGRGRGRSTVACSSRGSNNNSSRRSRRGTRS